ncbi:hypothetical protein ABT352_13285 [Streptosporangium sp. NPDC000563]|uniref:hypothetical protein n=1 Tax=unclassified Streptosporangium TaxID=2632669 RepID=UPI00331A8B0E
MLKKFSTGALMVAGLAMLTVVGTAGAANAASRSGSCTASGMIADAAIHYTTNTVSGKTTLDRFTWTIYGESGSTKNNVKATLMRDVSLSTDTAHYTWSTESAKNGYGSHTPSSTVSVPSSWKLYGKFKFIFDRNNLPDPNCNLETSRS